MIARGRGANPSPQIGGHHVGGVNLSELCRPDRGGVTRRGGDGIEVAAVVAVRNPHGFTGGEAGGGGEAHGVRV